ncbi:MAG TPA: acetyl-CoA acetyltransferase [Acidimicrobiales bacterium]
MSAMDRSLRGAAAIVGVTDDVSPTGELDRFGRDLEVAMVFDALEDAGLTLADVDGVCHPESAVAFAEYLGVHPTFVESTMTGGSSYEVHVEHAAAAIAAGICDVVVSVYAATPRSDRTQGRRREWRRPGGPNPMAEWDMPYGLRTPMGPYALAAARHMHEFGTTSEQLAQIAVSTRQWAALNPRARYRDPIDIDDVLASPLQVSPLHILDCCLVTDGAGAFVMTSAERARTLAKPPVYVLGAATCTDHMVIGQMPDLTTTPGAVSGPRAFEMAGLEPADVDVLMGYDSFTITALLHLEDLGFCKKGEGGPFVADGHLGPGGSLPMNTNGGGLSFTHPGMYGMFLLTEATRQLRGECGERQVAGADVAVAHGSGMFLSVMSTAVLGTEATL